ncbi:MOFRL family protein [Aminiphilus circumscriptus]|uniref:MOFRL family protein n=1 Tax=Aminiphilus circumscriptus TaxID=290732 RepID=UPI003B84A7A1
MAARDLPGVTLLSLDSDGTDGPTDAAGGITDGGSFARMHADGIDPWKALADNDAYAALDAAGDLLRLGPTGTNLNDCRVLLVE